MVNFFEQLFSVMWQEEMSSGNGEGFIANIFQKEDKEDPAN